MDIKLTDEPVEYDLYGLSGGVTDLDYAGTGRRLMDEMWRRVKENGLPHKGINYWVYDSATRMFTGLELTDTSRVSGLLEHKPVSLKKYVYYRHVGPYEKLGDVHRGLEAEMAARGLKETGPRVEKYGHWTEDESQLVTEVLIGVE